MSRSSCTKKDMSYNQRLFSGKGLRSHLHNSRFIWFQEILVQMGVGRVDVVEIGCFDGRLLDFFPVKPRRYEGIDAGWEGGLAEAQEKYRESRDWSFEKAVDATSLNRFADDAFDLGVAMETIEHIPPHSVDDYLSELARVVNGYLVVTVPNEKGIVFLAKWIVKKVFLSSSEEYSFSEIVAATFGNMQKVKRNEHKGFDYDILAEQINNHFQVVKVEGIPFRFLPKSLSFTIGIVAKSPDRCLKTK